MLVVAICQINASEIQPVGARSIALSHAFVSISDPWNTFHNQAGLANYRNVSAGFFYESRFMIEELALGAGTIVLPIGKGTYGFSFYQFGKGAFKEHKLGVAYARQLSQRLNAALQIAYFAQRYPENERAAGCPTFELGLTYAISKELTLGAHVFNPVENGFTYGSYKQKLPAIYRFGGHFLFSDQVLLSAEMEKESDRKALVKSGLEFSPVKDMALRFGVSGTPVRYTAGMGYKLGAVSTDFAFSYHGNLGITPSISVQIRLK